jgi:glycerol-3-phosphate dehydrogenase
VHRYFPHLAHTSLDVLDRFAGVRVLPTGTERAFNRARESVIEPFDTGNARIVTIYGGKLTTYRHTAELTLAQLQTALPKRKPIADTKKIHLS